MVVNRLSRLGGLLIAILLSSPAAAAVVPYQFIATIDDVEVKKILAPFSEKDGVQVIGTFLFDTDAPDQDSKTDESLYNQLALTDLRLRFVYDEGGNIRTYNSGSATPADYEIEVKDDTKGGNPDDEVKFDIKDTVFAAFQGLAFDKLKIDLKDGNAIVGDAFSQIGPFFSLAGFASNQFELKFEAGNREIKLKGYVNSLSAVSQVPVPATLPLSLGALALGAVFLRRRKT
jgi:hypothetical protein